MQTTNSNSRIDGPLTGTRKKPRLEEAPTGVSVGMDVTIQNKIKPTFLHLPEEIHAKIIRNLDFREVTRLARVCKYLRD
ncbi:F-box protein, partial [Endozoicomonas sp. SESOKO4]